MAWTVDPDGLSVLSLTIAFPASTNRSTESNSRPRLKYVGDKAWIAYQIASAKSRCVGVQIIDDDPEPVRTIVSTTAFTGDLDIQLHAEASHLWVTWIDSTSRLGYSEYSYISGHWSAPIPESYSPDSVAAARARIRSYVLDL